MALKRAAGKEHITVLDIGAGSGLLSMMAARCSCWRLPCCFHPACVASVTALGRQSTDLSSKVCTRSAATDSAVRSTEL